MKNVDEYLDSYVEGSSDPGTAVMLIGHWGSGKTHYISDYFRRRQQRSRMPVDAENLRQWKRWNPFAIKQKGSSEPAKGSAPEHLYASFFGAESAAAISDQFLSQLYPALNSTLGKVLGAAAIRVANLGVQIASAGAVADAASDEDSQAIRRWLSNPQGRVLVFDDLERAGMPIEVCLSIINSYVERDGLKVIVLANEEEINVDSAYGRWKEKVIGKTIRIVSDPESVLDSVLSELDEGPVRVAVNEGREALLAVMGVSKQTNYRSVRTLIFDVQRLVKMLDRRLSDSKEGVLELLKFSLAVGGELRAGRLSRDEVELVRQSFGIRVKERSKRTERDLYILDLEQRFESVRALNSVIPTSELISFWLGGALDVDVANAGVLQSPSVVGVESQPAWRRMWDLRRLTMARYEEARAGLLSSLDRRELNVQGEILHVVGISLTLEDYGVGLFPNFSEVQLWVSQYASDPKVFERLQRSVGWLEGADSYAGLGFHKRRDPRFLQAFDVLEGLVSLAEQRRLLADVPQILAEIGSGDYANVYSFSAPGSADGKPWIHLATTSAVADLLLQDGVIRSPLSALLIKRYADDAAGKFRVEWRSLRLLREELRRRVRLLPEPFLSIASDNIDEATASIRTALAQSIAYVRNQESRVRSREKVD